MSSVILFWHKDEENDNDMIGDKNHYDDDKDHDDDDNSDDTDNDGSGYNLGAH